LSEEANPPIGALSLFSVSIVTPFFSFAILLTEMKENDSVITATTKREVIIFAFIVIMIYLLRGSPVPEPPLLSPYTGLTGSSVQEVIAKVEHVARRRM
jgi:hypothetical protein